MVRERKTGTAVGGNSYRKAKGLKGVTVMLTPEEHRLISHAAVDAGLRGPGAYLKMVGVERAKSEAEKGRK